MWPSGAEWIGKCVQLAVAAAVVAFAKLTWFHLRRNVALRRQLDGPSESFLFGGYTTQMLLQMENAAVHQCCSFVSINCAVDGGTMQPGAPAPAR